MKAFSHFRTISYHKYMVMKGCFAVGLYWQGITHDLSKYMPSEFRIGVKYYQGNRSPNNAEREDAGYSSAWLHHKGRNKHHYEYWLDYSTSSSGGMQPAPMPVKYVVEMFMDRIAASKVYNKQNYSHKDPKQYYESGSKYMPIHKDTRELLEELLCLLDERGERAAYAHIKHNILKIK